MEYMLKNVRSLVEKRHEILASFADESDLSRLSAVESELANAEFKTDADKLAALKVLLDSECAEFTDEFKSGCEA
jgi:hypothetical protein